MLSIDTDTPVTDVMQLCRKTNIGCFHARNVLFEVKLFVSYRGSEPLNLDIQPFPFLKGTSKFEAVDTSLTICCLCSWLRSNVLAAFP
jgi:hypothetical protein